MNPIGSMERDNREIRMKQCVSSKGINRAQEITGFYGAGGMEVFNLLYAILPNYVPVPTLRKNWHQLVSCMLAQYW